MKLKVFMHSGEEYEIAAESYNAAELNEQRNDDTISSILIGDYSLSRINIRDVIPVHEESVEQPEEEPTEEPVEGPNEENNDVEK
ncbi:MAG: hypothetical protein ACI4G0_00250 [Ruminococcus sp.]